jgi:uncharacterized protein (DUF305 family)
MNPHIRLLAPIAIVMGTLGVGSLAIANLTTIRSPNPQPENLSIRRSANAVNCHLSPVTCLTTHPSSNSTLAQNHEGMNHGGMTNHNMDVGPADANYDLRFIDSMIPHHQGALVMAQEVLQKSKRPELIKLAKSIIDEQKKEILQMQKSRKKWYPKASVVPIMWHAGMNHEMTMTPAHKQSMIMSMSLGKADAEFDRRFLDAMIPHHQGAVTMGKDLLQKTKRPQMRKLAQSIIDSQQAEIDLMTKWRQEWYRIK